MKKTSVHHTFWDLLLYQDGIRAEERESNFSYVHSHNLEALNWEKRRILHWWCSSEVEKVWGPAYDLKETFDNLRKYKMMLNPKKYVFSVSSGKLLGYRVPSWGINANPKKVEAIAQLQPPQTRKKSRSWQVWWQHSADSYPSWTNVVCLSTSYYKKQMDSSRMIKQ
jgi:hypothetical protein